MYALASSFTEALLDSPFEHIDWVPSVGVSITPDIEVVLGSLLQPPFVTP